MVGALHSRKWRWRPSSWEVERGWHEGGGLLFMEDLRCTNYRRSHSWFVDDDFIPQLYTKCRERVIQRLANSLGCANKDISLLTNVPLESVWKESRCACGHGGRPGDAGFTDDDPPTASWPLCTFSLLSSTQRRMSRKTCCTSHLSYQYSVLF